MHRLKYCFFAAAAFSLAHPAQAAPKELTVVLNADIRSTNPGVNRDGNTDGVMVNIVEGLVGYGEDGLVKPVLARQVDVSADGLTYTFKLRDHVQFHNGKPMTSAEVSWSWKRYMDPKTDWRCRADFDGSRGLKVEETDTPDPATFVMRINKPAALFLDSLARPDCAMAAVIHPDSVGEGGAWKAPIGTGPFMLDKWVKGQYLTVKRFADYQSPPGDKPDGVAGKKTPMIDAARFLVVADTATIKAGLQSGALDISKIQSTDVKDAKNAHLGLVEDLTGARNAILFQTRDPLLKNVALRQAIAAAIDRDKLVAMVTDGRAKPNGSAVKLGSHYYDSTQAEYIRYDPKRAKELLKQAGYKGEKIRITTNNRDNIPSLSIAIVLQQMMRDVGIDADIDIVEWATHMDRFLKGNYQMMVHLYSSRIDPSLSYEHFVGPKATEPRKVWDDPAVQAMLEKSMVETRPEDRQQLFDAIHKKMIDDVPIIMLFNPLEPWAVSKRVKGFSPWEGNPRLWTVSLDQ